MYVIEDSFFNSLRTEFTVAGSSILSLINRVRDDVFYLTTLYVATITQRRLRTKFLNHWWNFGASKNTKYTDTAFPLLLSPPQTPRGLAWDRILDSR